MFPGDLQLCCRNAVAQFFFKKASNAALHNASRLCRRVGTFVCAYMNEISHERQRFLCASPSKLNRLAKPDEDNTDVQGILC